MATDRPPSGHRPGHARLRTVRGVTTHEHRFVPLDGAFNFRDLGGLATRDGGKTRAGVMFRSDALHHLLPGDVERLEALGMRTVIDLRSSVELERTGAARSRTPTCSGSTHR
jgi:hypothetical protein